MFKSSKQRGTSELELLPPVKGLNTLVPPDAVDKLSAVELNGEITGGKIGPQYGIESNSAGSFFKIFNAVIGNKNRLYGHKSDGIYEIDGSSATRSVALSRLTANSSTIRWDDEFLTANKGKLYSGSKLLYDLGTSIVGSCSLNSEGVCVYAHNTFYYGTASALWKGDQNGNFSFKVADGDFRTLCVWNGRMFRPRFFSYIWYMDEVLLNGQTIEYFRYAVPENLKSKNIDWTLFAANVVDDTVYSGHMEVFSFSMLSKTVNLVYSRKSNQLQFIFRGAWDSRFLFIKNNTDLVVTNMSGSTYTTITGLKNGGVGTITCSAPAVINGTPYVVYNAFARDGGGNVGSWIQNLLSSSVYERIFFIGYAIVTDGRNKYVFGQNKMTTTKLNTDKLRLFSRDGRVVAIEQDSTLSFSGVGDPANWKQENDADSLFVEIGYKDGGNITEVVNGYDVIVFKDNGKIYRMTGSYPNWSINTVANTEPLISNVKQRGTSLLYATASGVKELATSQVYGDYFVNDMRASVNLAGCKFIHISQLRESTLFAMPDGVYEYKQQEGTFTKISNENVDGIYENQSQLYVAKRGSVYRFLKGGNISYKYGRILSGSRFLIQSVTLYATGTGAVSVDAGGKVYEFACAGGSEPKKYKKRNIFTTNVIQPKVTITGNCNLEKILIEYSIIGG